MTEFEVNQLSGARSSLIQLYQHRKTIWLHPPYQRMGDVWTTDKRQLLIDSILNEFDIPKLYLHNVAQTGNKKYRYAVIDGRQRLETIWGFIDGDFSLADDFSYLHDVTVQAGGLTYSQLAVEYPSLKQLLDATSLPIIVIHTDDIDLIEEMFSRLNEAVPLNAAEKRNAFGGPLPKIIRAIADHNFLKKKIKISNARYQHRDIAAKLLLLEHESLEHDLKVADLKKIYLDEFVRGAAALGQKESRFRREIKAVKSVLDELEKVFTNRDSLLSSSGLITVYYLAMRSAIDDGWQSKFTRQKIKRFEDNRRKNRVIAEADIAKANYKYLEYDRLMQTPNDSYAIDLRVNILSQYLRTGKPPA